MDAKTLEALKASIRKWEKNAEVKTPDDYLIDSSDCPLCDLFFHKDCDGCPVYSRTGQEMCNGTPYREAFKAWVQWGRAPEVAHEAARKEVAFLKSLLPEGESV